jgi:hypothetical protein
MQCSNNLKQIGIAVHNFHDTKNGLPPLLVIGSLHNGSTGWSTNISFLSPTIFVYLLPFLEKQAIYDLISDDYVNSPANNAWWDALPDKKSMIISPYICPSRGSRTANNPQLTGGAVDDGRATDGFVSDYVTVLSINFRNTWKTDQCFRTYDSEGFQINMYGAFRAAITVTPLPTSVKPNWELRDNISRFQDGTSHQYLFAEKHIPSDKLGKCYNTQSDGGPTQEGWYDCGVQITRSAPDTPYNTPDGWKQNHLLLFNPACTVNSDVFVIARNVTEGNSNGENFWNDNVSPFGSYHTGGICHHLFGDSSVHGMSPNVDRERVHWPLGCVSDGMPVVFP